MRFADRHGEVEREPRQIAEANNGEEDHRRPRDGRCSPVARPKCAGRGEIIDGENGAEDAQLVIEGVEIAGLEGDEKADRSPAESRGGAHVSGRIPVLPSI